jgi:hypothetical protein
MGDASVQLDMEELRRLAWKTTVPADGDWEAQAQARIGWLAGATPEQWHSFALGFNWDDPLEPLFWIVRQDDCDMATALTIFWRSVPSWDLMKLANGEEVYDREEAPLIDYIANRIGGRGYQRRKIAWDPEPIMRSDYESIKAYVAAIGDPPWRPHRDMIRPVDGREIVESFEDWDARPEAVRTGFWLDLPPCDIVTPGMEEAGGQLGSSLFYLFALGAALPMLAALGGKPDENMLSMVVLLPLLGWWAWSIARGTSITRSLVRQELKRFPKVEVWALYAACFTMGLLAWLFYHEVLTPDPRPDMSVRAQWIEKSALAAALGATWFGLGRFARLFTYRYLFADRATPRAL